MNLIKKIYLLILKEINFKKYARKIGVNFSDDIIFIGHGISFGSEPYLITIGKHVLISNEVLFVNHDGGIHVLNDEKYKNVIKYGAIKVGNNVFIGQRSIIMPGVKIGDNVVIGAGSIVTKSIPSNTIVAGNPAKFICSYDDYCKTSFENSPSYDLMNYKKNKKNEVIEICSKLKEKKCITINGGKNAKN